MESAFLEKAGEFGIMAVFASFMLVYITRTLSGKLDANTLALKILTEAQNKTNIELVAQTVYLSQILMRLGLERPETARTRFTDTPGPKQEGEPKK